MKTIGIIALSGDVKQDKLDCAVRNLQKIGFKTKLSQNIHSKKRYLAGNDNDKLNELYRFFQDPEVDIIMCARGGYGSIRLINKIDYEVIKNNKKPFIGFSDVTALLLMIYKKAGITTYHGPMVCSDFADDSYTFSLENLQNALSNKELVFEGKNIYCLENTKGIIWGGNLATVVSLCGLDFIPDKNFIFFTEDLNEPVYKIDKMFTQLFNINKFRKYCKGIVLGDFLNVDNQNWLDELFYELAEEYKLPIIGGFKVTHNNEKITIPIGKMAELSGEILHIQ